MKAVRAGGEDALGHAELDLAECVASKCPLVNRLSLLVGYLRLSQGDPAGAIRQLSSHPPPDQLAALHAYYLGEARFYDRDYRRAADNFQRAAVLSPPWLASRAQLRQGEALLAAGSVSMASPLIERTAATAPSAELSYQRSLIRRAADNLAGEREDLMWIATHYPSHPYVALALARLSQIDRRAFRFTLEERLARARAFTDAGGPEAALRELNAAAEEKLARGKMEQAELARHRAAVLLTIGRVDQAEEQVNRALAGPPEIASEAALLRARWALRKDRHPQARAELAEIERRYPTQPAAEEAGFLTGWLELQDGRLDAAIAAFLRFEKRHRRSHRLADAIWFRGIAWILKREYSQAQPALQRLIHAFPRSELVPGARYWIVRSQQLRGSHGPEIADQYLQVAKAFPGSLYALLSQERLRDLGEDPPPTFPDPPEGLDEPTPAPLRLAAELCAAGLFADGAREIEAQIQAVRSEEQALHLGHALQQLEAYGAAYSLGVRWLWRSAYATKDGSALALLYPQAYRADLEREANQEGVDPFLVWAVMRRESSFRLEAHSAADARGLMQLMPATGASIANELREQPPSPNELFAPELNIRLAVWYLTQLVKRFGHPALSAAAYNAGPATVARWAEQRAGVPLDLFIEQIPYKETRNYVRQVIADYYIYHQLYGDPAKAPHLSLEIPKPTENGINF